MMDIRASRSRYREDERPTRIGYWLAERGMTQQQLADRLGVTRATVNKWINGGISPQLKDLQEVAQVLRVSTCELLNTSDNVLAVDAGAREILEAWQAVPVDRRPTMVETVVSVLRLAAEDPSPSSRSQPPSRTG